jgi:hypothetical protein
LQAALEAVEAARQDVAAVQAQIDAAKAEAAATGADHTPGHNHRYRRVSVPEVVRLTEQRTELEKVLRERERYAERLARPAKNWAEGQG